MGRVHVAPWSTERENWMIERSSSQLIHATYRLPWCLLVGDASTQMRDMSTICGAVSSGFGHTFTTTGGVGHVRPPSAERCTQMPLFPAWCAQ